MTIKIIYDLKIEEEETPVRGNALASGDDEADREAEDEIIQRLERGDIIAWCSVMVTARVEGTRHAFEGRAHLGCCSYTIEADLRRDVFECYSLKAEALTDLMARLQDAMAIGDEAEAISEQVLAESKALAAPKKARG